MKGLIRLVSVASILLLNLPAKPASRIRPALIQVELSSPEAIKGLLTLGLDIIEVKRGEYARILVSDEEVTQISEAGYTYKVLYPDMTAHLQATLGTGLDMGGYHTADEIYAALDSIHNEHPTITTPRDTIGFTIQGRPICAMKISDNPNTDEDEPEVFFNSLTHAREPMGMEVVLYFMRYLTNNYGSDARVDSLVNNRELWFVPLVNPDGYLYNELIASEGGGLWRKNRRNNGDGTYGVDLNRNYGHKWGYNNSGSSPVTSGQTYRGTGPFSEPETQSIRDFVLAHNFVITVNYHTYGDYFLYTWGYAPFQPPDRVVYQVLAETATSVNHYIWGPGYLTLYETNGDADDWMYGEMFAKKKSLSFTPEVGGYYEGGFWPPAYLIPTMAEENLEANLLLAEQAGPLSKRSFWSLALEPPFIDTLVYVGDSLILPLTLYNHGNLGSIYLKALSTESPEWLALEPENVDTTLLGFDSLILKVKLTSQNVGSGGNYYSEIRLLSYNDSTPVYRDTTLIPVSVQIICGSAQLPGDVDANGSWSLADVIYLTNFVFDKSRVNPACSGTEPGTCWPFTPVCRGDVNGSGGSPNLQDVIYLVNYVFDKSRVSPACNGADPGNCWKPVATDACCYPAP